MSVPPTPSHCCFLPPSPALLLQFEDIVASLGDDFSGTAFLPSNKVSAPVGWLLQYHQSNSRGAAVPQQQATWRLRIPENGVMAGRCSRTSST